MASRKLWASSKRRGAKKTAKLVVNKLSEAYIQKQIMHWLAKVQREMMASDRDLIYWRQNSGKLFFAGRMINLGMDGLPDIMCLFPVKLNIGGDVKKFCCAFGLEVKSEKGRLRPSQKAFAQRMTNIGGDYFVVRSLESAKDAVAAAIGERFF